MEYQKIINLLNHTSNKTTKFRTKNWVETNDGARHIAKIIKLNLKFQC